jgi:hypothetical protein
MPYRPAEDIDQYLARVRKTRECFLEGKSAEEFFSKLADMFGVDLNRSYDVREFRKLPKSKVSLSEELSKARAEKYADLS